MDKYEFNLRVNQIKILVNRGDYRTAMKIADIIDWKRVKNASLLCKISQIYEMNEAYKKAADILRMTWGLMAQDDEGLYQILYKYMELAIKRGDSISTKSTYDMFCSLCNEEDPRQYLL